MLLPTLLIYMICNVFNMFSFTSAYALKKYDVVYVMCVLVFLFFFFFAYIFISFLFCQNNSFYWHFIMPTIFSLDIYPRTHIFYSLKNFIFSFSFCIQHNIIEIWMFTTDTRFVVVFIFFFYTFLPAQPVIFLAASNIKFILTIILWEKIYKK